MRFLFKRLVRTSPAVDDATVRLADVAAYIQDPERAAVALCELQRLERLELIDVYLPAGWVAAGHRRFNVWLSHRMQPPHGARITLEEWCARWQADRAAHEGHGRDGEIGGEPA